MWVKKSYASIKSPAKCNVRVQLFTDTAELFTSKMNYRWTKLCQKVTKNVQKADVGTEGFLHFYQWHLTKKYIMWSDIFSSSVWIPGLRILLQTCTKQLAEIKSTMCNRQIAQNHARGNKEPFQYRCQHVYSRPYLLYICFSVLYPNFTIPTIKKLVRTNPTVIKLRALSSYTTNKHFFT